MADLLLKKEASLDRFRVLRQSGGIIFYVSIGLLLFTIASFGGLAIYNRSQVNTKDELIREVEIKQEELRPELLNQIFNLESRLKNMHKLLSTHTSASNILGFLEKNTLPQVRFLNFDLKTDTRRLEMAGEATSYATLANQIVLLEKNTQIEKVEFGGLTLGSGNLVNFHLTLIFKPSIFKPIPTTSAPSQEPALP